jgi:hypothetical protein
MVKVVAGVGIQGPTRLVSEIVDQAEGRPGLAATLARLCLQGDIREVMLPLKLADGGVIRLADGHRARAREQPEVKMAIFRARASAAS